MQIGRRAVALIRVFREAAFDDPPELQRRAGIKRRHRRLVIDDRIERRGRSLAPECGAAGDHLVEDQAERELVGMKASDGSTRLLRAHVRNGPGPKAELGLGLEVAGLAEIEIDDAELQAAFEEVAKRFRGGKSGSNGKERGAAIAGQTSANPASDASSGTGEA